MTRLSLALLSLFPAIAFAEDAERATHGDQAAIPQVSYQVDQPDFVLRQYQLGCLSQLTYLIGSGGEAVVVDPQRDVDHYIRDAESLGLKITKVVLTHTNADFVAGHTELATRVGAEVLISAKSGSEFKHRGLVDGDKVALGKATLEFWATPGHTLDSMTMLVHAPGAAVQPAYITTGDALFIGGIGRPDLASDTITPMYLANLAFDSIARLKTLPDATMVLPGHGAGSLCGAHLAPDTTSTIGHEKANNPFLVITSRAQFVSRDVSGLPVAPQYFHYNVAMNRKGPPVVDWTAELPPAMTPAAVKRELARGAWLIDLRDGADYTDGHVSGSVNVAARGRLDTWTGIVVPFEARLVLMGTEDEVREATFRFRRIGLDHVVGHLAGGMSAWQAAGLPVRTSTRVSPAQLAEQMKAGTEPVIVDVRTDGEYHELRVGDYANIPVSDWTQFGKVLDPSRPVVMVCNSAYRSSMAVGLAERQGFENVASLDGGLDAWLTAGLPALGTNAATAASAHGAAPAAGAHAAPVAAAPRALPASSAASNEPPLLLPEAIEPSTLASALMDAPGTWTVLDVRPAWQFAEYHVPGSENVTVERLAARITALPAGTRVVLADRDGTLAWAAAGACTKPLGATGISLRVLSGGTARFWREIEVPRTAGSASVPPSPGARSSAPAVQAAPSAPAAPSAMPAPVAPTPAPAPAPAAPKKRSAGC